ncbi:hypothetical protein [Yellowstone lake phycodnavirus 2]|jgi:hypothetical protein|uniref:hypothetical protein n=1 Tax=Yellowstone lake phycodnavirus 2 TaxID=1586714 RepID=UPI0006EBB21C|nr:hypothetical protein AR678_gp176 [Yellowstone lake phycodnavirus 2]BAT22450.1 hypothetical protein [Yellowstone lake phycodnavirus 2]
MVIHYYKLAYLNSSLLDAQKLSPNLGAEKHRRQGGDRNDRVTRARLEHPRVNDEHRQKSDPE